MGIDLPQTKTEVQNKRLRHALEDLVDAVVVEVDEKGGGGYLLARLSDAMAALKATE